MMLAKLEMKTPGELLDDIMRLRRALQKIANLPLKKTATFKNKPDAIVRATQIAIRALRRS